MNHYSQQPAVFQEQQQGFQNQSREQQFQPSGFVQSHYQGQLSQPTFGRETGAIVSQSPNNYQSAQNQNFNNIGQYSGAASSFNTFSQPAANNSFISHQPVQSHASSPATAFGNVGPVIAHAGGYQAQNQGQQQQQQQFQQQHTQNQSFYQPASQQSHYTQPIGQQSYGIASSHLGNNYGMTQANSHTPLNPVYKATNAYEQAGPVISQVGWQSNAGNQQGGMR